MSSEDVSTTKGDITLTSPGAVEADSTSWAGTAATRFAAGPVVESVAAGRAACPQSEVPRTIAIGRRSVTRIGRYGWCIGVADGTHSFQRPLMPRSTAPAGIP